MGYELFVAERGTAYLVGTGQPADDALGKRPALVDLARAVHEARTPPTAIIGFAEILAREKHGPISHPKYADSAKAIEEGGRYLLDIVNEILDFSGAGRVARRDLHLGQRRARGDHSPRALSRRAHHHVRRTEAARWLRHLDLSRRRRHRDGDGGTGDFRPGDFDRGDAAVAQVGQ